MRLSAPIYRLKRQARLLARRRGLPLHEALDRTAVSEGFQSWSHLAAAQTARPAAAILAQAQPGDLILVGARPGQGKTLLGLELAARATSLGRTGFFFTLADHARAVDERFAALGIGPRPGPEAMCVDTSDDVSADYVIDAVTRRNAPALIVIDYLQILDQKRSNPPLQDQIGTLRRFVTATGAICAVSAQIDRSFDLSGRAMPDLADIRLPNPADLSVFDGLCFLHDGAVRMARAA